MVDVRHMGPTDLDEHDPDVVAVDQPHSMGGRQIQVVPATDHVLICAGELPSVCVPLADTREPSSMQLSMDSYGKALHIHMTSERLERTGDLPVTPRLHSFQQQPKPHPALVHYVDVET